MRRLPLLALAAGALGGCGDLQGLGGPSPPLVTFQVLASGDLTRRCPAGSAATQSLQVALVWGAQWLTEPFCILPPVSPDPAAAAAVIAAGCRDPFGFVPALVAASVPIEIGTPASLSLADLPSADLMVGDITARVAYASLVVYDDCDGSGTLELAIPHRTARGGPGPEQDDTPDSGDVIYGASFWTMTAPDQRVAFREGGFVPTAFYPRSGCDDPFPAFSVLAAGGFTYDEGIASALAGTLPAEDPATCLETQLPAEMGTDPTIHVSVEPPAMDQEVGCIELANDSSTRYRRPPADAPDLSGRLTACAKLPSFEAGDQPDLSQLVVSGRGQDRCKGLTHYTLRGCRENVACPVPDWDFTATPPAWWPCSP